MVSPNARRTKRLKAETRRVWNNVCWATWYSWKVAPFLLIVILATAILASALPAATAWAARGLINAVVNIIGQGLTHVKPALFWIFLVFGLTMVQELYSASSDYLRRHLEARLEVHTATDILNHASTLDLSLFEDPKFQDVVERVRQSAVSRFSGFVSKIIGLVRSTLQVVSLVAVLFIIDPWVAIILIPTIFPFTILKWEIVKKHFYKQYSRATKRRWTRYYLSTLTHHAAVPETKLLNLAPVLTGRYQNLNNEFVKEDLQIYKLDFILNLVFSALLTSGFYLLFIRVINLVVSSALTIGDIALFISVTSRLRTSLNQIVLLSSGALEEALYAGFLEEFLSVQPRLLNNSDQVLVSPQGDIGFDNVTFAYPGTHQPVLSNLSLHIKPGETVALVGENGAGKTTLVKLLARLYDPDQGSITFDGIDLRDLSLEYLQSQISFVFQSFNRFEASVEENIAYGDWQKVTTREQVEQIASQVHIHDMIEAMPQGYDTMLGRMFGEYDLSGGQWQKIAIARAMARSSSLLILDEPTASLDARAEYELFQQFRKLALGRTTILISHRFSTVSMANRIIVMDKGRIIESGTHDDLVARDGHYAQLYALHYSLLADP